jgi:hypothetical protein
MWQDPIVDEIHKIREEIMQEHDNDIHKLCEHLRERQRNSGRKVVDRSVQQPGVKDTDLTQR